MSRQVFFYFSYDPERDYSYLLEVVRILNDHGFSLFFTPSVRHLKGLEGLHFEVTEDLSKISKDFELFITYGGDGTILRAATVVRDSGVPVFGINAGRLGFLANIPKENALSAIKKYLKEEFYIQSRSLLSITSPHHAIFGHELNFALNELTISRKNTTSMISVDVYINNEFLSTYWADGLIVSTPTGSTGYSMSCGGPILTPDTQDFIINAIAPHNLTVRPLVLPNHNQIKLIPHGRGEEFLISLDSRFRSLPFGTEIEVCKAPFKINFIQFEDYTFIKTLRRKLFWGYDNRNN